MLAQAEKQKQQQNGVASASKEKAQPVAESTIDKAKMIRQIENMNRINGAGKEIDAVKMVDALCDKYGDKAATLLTYAINEPYKYAEYMGDKSIKTSRAALNDLCSLKSLKEQQVVEYAEAKMAGRELPTAQSFKQQQNGVATASKEKAQPVAESSSQSSSEQLNKAMQADHSRVTAMRDKLRQGHVEVADKTRVNKIGIAERLRFESAIQPRAGNHQPITADYLSRLLNQQLVNQ